MTERHRCKEIAGVVINAKANSAVAFLNSLKRKMGSEVFRKTFSTHTFDGGSEFMDIEGIERSCIDGLMRTRLYFAHPYAAYKWGTNERHNRMLKAFFSEGL